MAVAILGSSINKTPSKHPLNRLLHSFRQSNGRSMMSKTSANGPPGISIPGIIQCLSKSSLRASDNEPSRSASGHHIPWHLHFIQQSSHQQQQYITGSTPAAFTFFPSYVHASASPLVPRPIKGLVAGAAGTTCIMNVVGRFLP
jgi:hypothetical protein